MKLNCLTIIQIVTTVFSLSAFSTSFCDDITSHPLCHHISSSLSRLLFTCPIPCIWSPLFSTHHIICSHVIVSSVVMWCVVLSTYSALLLSHTTCPIWQFYHVLCGSAQTSHYLFVLHFEGLYLFRCLLTIFPSFSANCLAQYAS